MKNYPYNIKDIEKELVISLEFDMQSNVPALKNYFEDYTKMSVVVFQIMSGWYLVSCSVNGDNLF